MASGETSTQDSGRLCLELKAPVMMAQADARCRHLTPHIKLSVYLHSLGGVSGGVEAHIPVAGSGDQVGTTAKVQPEVQLLVGGPIVVL